MSEDWTRLPILADARHTQLDPNMSFRFNGRARRYSSSSPPVGPFGQWLFNDKTQSAELITSGII